MTLEDIILNSDDMISVHEEQTSERIDPDTWKEVKPGLRKIADNVVIQIIDRNKERIKSQGPLYLLRSTYLFIERDPDGNIITEKSLSVVDGKDVAIDKDNVVFQDYPIRSTHKVDTYVQRQQKTNELIAYEILTELNTDITRYCSRLNKASMEERRFPPILIAIILYSSFLNFILLAPELGIFINWFDTIPFGINVFVLTSLAWYVYSEYIAVVYWMTAETVLKTPIQLHFDLKEYFGNTAKKRISVDRVFNVHRIRVFFSHVALTEALHRNEKYIVTELVRTLQAQYSDAQFNVYLLEKRIVELITKNTLLAQETEKFKQRIKESVAEYFVKGYRLRYTPKFDYLDPGKKKSLGLSGSNVDINSLLKITILVIGALLGLFIIAYWLLPFGTDFFNSIANVDIIINEDTQNFFFWAGVGVLMLFGIIALIRMFN